MTKSEIRMTKECRMTNDEKGGEKKRGIGSNCSWDFLVSLVILVDELGGSWMTARLTRWAMSIICERSFVRTDSRMIA